MSGHINLDSNAGNLLYEYSKRDDVNIIFEIGTWNGLGTTNCIYEAIKGTNKKLITCETNLAMYQTAKSNLQNKSEITLYRGKVTDEMVDLDEFDDSFHQKYSKEEKLKWKLNDFEDMKQTECILSKIPEKIDLLVLDGGEFTSYHEYLLLKARSKYIFLDDTVAPSIKNHKSRLDMIKNHTTIIDCTYERYGYYLGKI